MTARAIEFTIPSVPPSLNAWSRKHWSVRRRLAEDWLAWVAIHAPAWCCVDPAMVTLSFTLPHGGDADNRAKFVLDGLVAAKSIKGDGPPHLAELRLRATRGKPAQTHVRIEPA